MSLLPHFPLPVLFVIYAYKTVLVFIMLKNFFFGPSFLGLRKESHSLQLFPPPPPRAVARLSLGGGEEA